MKIIYCCFGGAHSSPVAAAIHLGILPADRLPTRQELLQLPLFDRNDQQGTLHYMGKDERGHEVYVLGRGRGGKIAETTLINGYNLAGGQADRELVIVDTLKCVNLIMRIGGYLSRRLRLVFLGRPLVLVGTQRAFRCLVAVVEAVKAEVR